MTHSLLHKDEPIKAKSNSFTSNSRKTTPSRENDTNSRKSKGKHIKKHEKVRKRDKSKNKRGKTKTTGRDISSDSDSTLESPLVKRVRKDNTQYDPFSVLSADDESTNSFTDVDWDVGSYRKDENIVRDVVFADFCSLQQNPMLLCMWKGYTDSDYVSWEPLQNIEKEQKHRCE